MNQEVVLMSTIIRKVVVTGIIASYGKVHLKQTRDDGLNLAHIHSGVLHPESAALA